MTFFFTFQIGGIALVAIGGVALKKIGDVEGVFDNADHPGIYSAFIIALGALVFVVAFFGNFTYLKINDNVKNNFLKHFRMHGFTS